MKTFIKLLIGLALVLMTIGTGWAAVTTTTLTIPVIQSTDDHEEIANDSGTAGQIDSGDLDLGKDAGNKMRVGVRFQDVTIPQGATIVSAYIQFVSGSGVEVLSFPQNREVKLKIKGEDKDDTLTFAQENKNIKDRWDNYDTSNDVSWTINTDWAADEKVLTPDLKDIVQEIVDRSGWTSGNAMVFMLSRSDRDNKRVVYSYDGSPVDAVTSKKNFAPKLIITYESAAAGGGGTSTVCPVDIRVNTNSDDADDREDGKLYNNTLRFGDKWVGLRFASVPVPQGAEIVNASLKLATGLGGSGFDNKDSDGMARVQIWGQKSDSALTFTTTTDDIKDRPRTSSNVRWTESDYWNTYKETHTSPDIANIIQEIVGRSGWASNNAMALLLEDDKGRRPVLAHDDNPDFAPLLHIEYTCGSGGTVDPDPQPTIQLDVASSSEIYLGASITEGGTAPGDTLTVTNSGAADLTYTITGMPSWFSLSKETGTLVPGASDAITVTYDSAALAIGTYQGTLNITDPNATNPDQSVPISLYIYAVPDTNSSCNNVPLYVQNRVSPAVLINLDLSGSMRTMMPVTQAGTLPQSPELKTIVQELVDVGTSWISGNDMVFIVTGSGGRRAWSYNGQSGSAPQLFVTYTADAGVTSTTISKRVADNRDDAEQRSDGSNYSDSRSELNLGSRVIGMRFQGLAIPQGATITNAYITFTISSPDTGATSLTFYGEKIDDAPRFSSNSGLDVTTRTRTTANVTWSNVPAWDAPTEMSRLTIAQNVIGDIVKNRNINWGFGTWTGDYSSAIDYTKIEVGCKTNDATQQTALQTAIAATQQGGRTPFVPSMNAAGKYFAGTKTDIDGGTFTSLSCQDKFVIEVTDGLANIPDNTSAADHATATTNLANAGISSVAVGFGIDNASMIEAVAATANTLGKASETDGLYALHDEVSGVGVPFLAMNQDQLLDSLLNISHKIENRFTGSAPAPTTSADDTDLLMVLVAEFGSASWTGDLRALGYSLLTNDWTTELWKASAKLPASASRNIWTAETGVNGTKVLASASTGLTTSDFLCKGIGDIINSAPVIVKWPNSHYSIDSYRTFANTKHTRNNMVYVGANDGQLHAFLLTDKKDGSGTVTTAAGTEMWSFIPPYLHSKLNLSATDPNYRMCDTAYCHQYYVDGSPQMADIYTGSAWRTILVTGLREGGEAYFALDITDGETMSSSATTGAQYLWQFTDTELGQTWGDARINRVADGASTTARAWGVFFGSGYHADGNGSSAQTSSKESYLYGINAYDASKLWINASGVATNRIKIDTSGTPLVNDALSELLVIDKDFEANFAADFIYTGNLYGDMFRVSNIGKGQTPAVSQLYESGNTTTKQPIRARPSFAYGEIRGDYWLYFGTGRYELDADKTSTDQQYFFGLKETPDTKADPSDPDTYTTTYVKPAGLEAPGKLTIDKTATNKLSTAGAPDLVVLDSTPYTITVGTASKVVKVVEGQNEANEPWVVRLGTSGFSERVTTQPLVVAGVVFFTSFIPDADPCGGSGSSYLYALDFKTGKAPLQSVFDINGDAIYNAGDYITDSNGNDVPVAAVPLGKGQASEVTIVGDKIFITTTEPDDGGGGGGGGGPDNPPPKPIGVNLPGLRASVDSWFDSSLD